MIGDVDEIPHPLTLKRIKACEGYSLGEEAPIVLLQHRYNYNLWYASTAISTTNLRGVFDLI
jgi:hypothetical protein